ncbi:hypothetical protein MZM54_22995 [[Brevibacterium] frigoritolerans]|nr:hypothetical protein [Peribacillus frigoritolerans]
MVQLKPEYDKCISFEDEDIPLSITLQELLDQLNEVEKSIFILKFYEGYSFKEIADLLNMPIE